MFMLSQPRPIAPPTVAAAVTFTRESAEFLEVVRSHARGMARTVYFASPVAAPANPAPAAQLASGGESGEEEWEDVEVEKVGKGLGKGKAKKGRKGGLRG